MANTIILLGVEGVDYVRKEIVAAAAITPGDLIDQGSAGTVAVHASAGGNARPMFALENDIVGDGIDDDYDSGDTVQCAVCRPGCEVNALIAHGENIAIGDWLVSNGDGSLAEYTAQNTSDSDVTIAPRAIVARAKAALNNTTGAAARLRVEVL